jgi:type I restriction enzyme S subunit
MAGRYKPYPEYTDSGVEWLGGIPKHWMSAELKRYSTVQGGYAFSSDSFTDVGKAVIRIGDIKQDGSVSLESCKYIQVDDVNKYSQYQVHDGDLLMAMTGATIGKAGWYKEAGSALLNQRVGSFKCNKNYLNYRFFWYVLSSSGYQEYIKLTAFGGAQPNISDAGMVGYPAAFPLNYEQELIANFLDHETAKIDTLIEKQQLLIQLLKEKRQAVISHAVTKGLSSLNGGPNAKLRDSGVEWLGEVPEHWDVRSVSHASSKITNGYVGPTRDILVDEGVSYVQATHIKNGSVNFDGAYFVRPEWSNAHSKSILFRGDVLIVQTGAGTGDVGLVSELEEGFNCHALIIVQPVDAVISGEYLSMVLQSQYGYSTLYSIRTGGMHPHLNCGEVQYVKLPMPPRYEQDEITGYISEQIQKFDLLVNKQLNAISLMQERRTALISAAVTGKIDVRDWIAPQASPTHKEVAA